VRKKEGEVKMVDGNKGKKQSRFFKLNKNNLIIF
jgi:hypothetical protein